MRKRPVSVIELAGYRRRADELLTREQQDALIDLVAYEPTFGDLIPGSGGLRKARVGIEKGVESAAARVSFIIFTTQMFRFSCLRSMRRTKRAI
jgi:hypothetical protein